MKIKPSVPTFRVLLVLAVTILATDAPTIACGEKFLTRQPGVTRDRVDRAGVTATVLLYQGRRGGDVAETLEAAGHKVTFADDFDEFEHVIADERVDLVLVGYDQARALEEHIQSASLRPTIIPVLAREHRRETSKAKREFGIVVNQPVSVRRLMRAINKALVTLQ